MSDRCPPALSFFFFCIILPEPPTTESFFSQPYQILSQVANARKVWPPGLLDCWMHGEKKVVCPGSSKAESPQPIDSWIQLSGSGPSPGFRSSWNVGADEDRSRRGGTTCKACLAKMGCTYHTPLAFNATKHAMGWVLLPPPHRLLLKKLIHG